MEHRNYIEDIRQIRSLMEKSSKFMSLSGASGVVAGVIALLGSWLASWYVFGDRAILMTSTYPTETETILRLVSLGLGMMVLALGTAIWLTVKKGHRKGYPIWNTLTREMLISLFVPLGTGGLLMLFFVINGFLGLVIPFSLIFYGLGLINASKFTYTDLHTLGIMQVVLGLVSLVIPAYSIWIWALGFGILHILYGTIMHVKYGS